MDGVLHPSGCGSPSSRLLLRLLLLLRYALVRLELLVSTIFLRQCSRCWRLRLRPPPRLRKCHQASISWAARLKHEERFKGTARLLEFKADGSKDPPAALFSNLRLVFIRKRRLIKIPFEGGLERFPLFIMIFLPLLIFPMRFEVLLENSIPPLSAPTTQTCQSG